MAIVLENRKKALFSDESGSESERISLEDVKISAAPDESQKTQESQKPEEFNAKL